MRNARNHQEPLEEAPANRLVRCAIYTRKSTEEGLQQEFNSLDAQREAAEAFIASQRHEGWTLIPDSYDDGGYTGANMERPALKRLLADIEAYKVDCVVVYKVDRLSRSLLDFARMVEIFEKCGVSFVSVTQQFNTTASLGRLTLNILLSFAQFEREIIAERTRDKMSAARRKGKWVGGSPVLGYDVAPGGGRLIVNEDEARRVRAIFDLYLKYRTLIPTVREINRRGWTTKQWTTKSGLFGLLTNVIYTGQVNHKGTFYPGEHQAIVDPAVWSKVDERLRHNGITGGKEARNKYGALLRGLLYCDACGTAMLHTYTVKGARRYRYYVCSTAQQRGWDACPSKSLPAQRVEDSIVERIRGLGSDPRIAAETARKVHEQIEASSRETRAELKTAEKELNRYQRELVKVAAMPGNGLRTDRMADLQERIQSTEQRLAELRSDLDALDAETVSPQELKQALEAFDPVWKSLNTSEQSRIIRALVERVGYDGRTGKISVAFRAAGFKTLCDMLENNADQQ